MPIVSNKKIILASGSETRKKMLETLNFDFKVIKPRIDEEEFKAQFKKKNFSYQPSDLGLFLAQEKAKSITKANDDAIIIAADQICECNGEVFDKPGSSQAAIEHLKKLRSKVHLQTACTSIYEGEKEIWSSKISAKVSVRDLSDEEIEAYVHIENPIHSAGAYMLEMHGKHIFKSIEGDHDVILGLPLVEILNVLYENKALKMEK